MVAYSVINIYTINNSTECHPGVYIHTVTHTTHI